MVTCAERIGEHKDRTLLGFREQVEALHKAADSGADGEYDEILDGMYGEVLGVSETTVYKVELSWGGPSDWLEVVCEGEKHAQEITRIIYHFTDWFDHAEIELEGEEYDVTADWVSHVLPIGVGQ